jgi:hypothetical protein
LGALAFSNAPGYINATAVGYGSSATESYQVRVGSSLVTSIGGYVNWTNISDGRFKENLSENDPGLSFITQLHPVTYRLNRNPGSKYSKVLSDRMDQPIESLFLGFNHKRHDFPGLDKHSYAGTISLELQDFVSILSKY